MAKKVIHQRKVRKAVLGDGTLTTSACGRFRTLSDGMNLSDDEAEVTCSFCRNLIAGQKVRAEIEATNAKRVA